MEKTHRDFHLLSNLPFTEYWLALSHPGLPLTKKTEGISQDTGNQMPNLGREGKQFVREKWFLE